MARAGKDLPRELALRTVKVSKLEMLDWIDEPSFPIPKDEAFQDEKDLEQRLVSITTSKAKSPVENDKKEEEEKMNEELNEGEDPGNPWKPRPACRLRMTVSGGFYVRSLCYDLGAKLNSGAYMAELVRTRQGDFTFEDAVPWEDFTEGGPWEDKVVSILKNPPKPVQQTNELKESEPTEMAKETSG